MNIGDIERAVKVRNEAFAMWQIALVDLLLAGMSALEEIKREIKEIIEREKNGHERIE